MNPGPAPTLVNDWFTWPLVIGVACVAFLTWFIVRMVEKSAELDAFIAANDERIEQGPPAYEDTCGTEYCNGYASVILPGPDGRLVFVCRVHAAPASEWTGPALYNQDEASA